MWKLSNKDQRFIDYIDDITQEEIDAIPKKDESAVFIKPMNEAEYAKYQREEVQGWRKVLDRFKV